MKSEGRDRRGVGLFLSPDRFVSGRTHARVAYLCSSISFGRWSSGSGTITWEIIGPVSTPMKAERNSCLRGSTEPFAPITTPFISANPGMVARLTDKSESQEHRERARGRVSELCCAHTTSGEVHGCTELSGPLATIVSTATTSATILPCLTI